MTPTSPHRRALTSLVTAAALAMCAAAVGVPVAAQSAGDPPVTAAPTTTPTSGGAGTTSSTQPGSTTRPTVTTVPGSTTTTSVPSTTSSTTAATTTTTLGSPPTPAAPAPVDAIDEDGADDPPPPQVVPPRLTPRARTPVDDAIAKLVGTQVKAAQIVTTRASADSAAANKALTELEGREADLQRTYDALHADQASAAQRLKQMRTTMRARAVALYVTGPSEPPIPVATDAYSYGRRRVLIHALQQADKKNLVNYQAAKEQAGDAVNQLVSRLEGLNQQVTAARADAELKAAVVQRSLVGLGTLQASSAVAVNGFVFPVADPHNFTSTFGAPRMVGTPYYHLHQGNDIFAPYGAPLFACERGVIAKMGTNRLGGTKLWVIGESGTTYYYAHLSAFADNIADGTLVEGGAVVGYVGNTGNAATTPPHLHFEIHPNDGPAVDPYAILKTVDDTVRRLGLNTTTTTGPLLPTAPVTATP